MRGPAAGPPRGPGVAERVLPAERGGGRRGARAAGARPGARAAAGLGRASRQRHAGHHLPRPQGECSRPDSNPDPACTTERQAWPPLLTLRAGLLL